MAALGQAVLQYPALMLLLLLMLLAPAVLVVHVWRKHARHRHEQDLAELEALERERAAWWRDYLNKKDRLLGTPSSSNEEHPA